ncbi:endonuclease/exonuclease/phosphatase family protein [Nocardioides sp. Kera G14]|uniref:endonuclease/exonuclease/phosphatase family protein n=1 Tax=Nocardioides sp. Kera G14 TaxID=2884264 RepID=UPI001D1072B3|nr:endonuclease/exonuclease/phosphatase family protein [Nocardioides sp. Kera G14]UDY24545.1 endonuclease/exonuclease/phosphatase family protein [Nocardioides sp. Kera G14]
MGRHAGERPRPRRSRPRRDAAVAVVLLVAALVAGAFAVLRTTDDTPSAVPEGRSASPSATAGPMPLVPGVRFTTRIYTLAELKPMYAKKGMTLVSGDPSKPTTFVSASYNVLGSSHAKDGPGRAGRGGALLRAKGVSVVGLQEFQSNQHGSLLSAGGFVSYPEGGGLDGENAIAWDPDVWTLVEGQMQSIPYFFGKGRNMPVVLLRNKETGRLVWWMNVHNPADVFGCKCGGFRSAAISKEIARINALHADGTPVFFTGDLNDRSAVVCRIAVGAHMTSSDGSHSTGGSCRPSGSLWIDWIWGSDDQVTFSDYNRDYRTRNSPRMSDHPMITATTTIAPAKADDSCESYKRHQTTYWFCPDPTLKN